MSAHTPRAHDLYVELSDRFSQTLAAVSDWSAATPCEGWNARDAVDHVITTQREFLSGVDLPLPADAADDAVPARWSTHVAAVAPLLADDRVADRPYEGFFGPTSIGEVMTQFYCLDLLVHRWDLARSQGQEVTWTPEELDRIEQSLESYGEAAYMPGIFGPPLEVADDAPRAERLLARMGRRP